jgi:polyisoprenoid-binding protein YceI
MTSKDAILRPAHAPAGGRYVLDPERTTITFRTRHMFGLAPVKGRFKLGNATVTINDPVEGSTVQALVSSASFSTRNPLRDIPVRSLLFLRTKRFPTISFHSEAIEWRDGVWHIRGPLLVKGQSSPVDLMIDEITTNGTSVSLQAHGEIDRYAHGVTAMKGMAGRTVTVVVTAEGSRL